MAEFHSLAGNAIEAIRINAVTRVVRNGRALLIKRRRGWSGIVARCANVFFRIARHPGVVWENIAEWQKWEIACFDLLHGAEAGAFAEGADAVGANVLPGTSIAEHFERETFRPEMLDAAARELRRAHALPSDFFGGAWSHGDANLANFLFSENENRARLIDFELAHPRELSTAQRHAEDLLTFLQDLLGCCTREEDWLSFARRFLDGYGDGAARELLCARLAIPRRVPRVWWWIRTNYISTATLRRRVSALRELLATNETAARIS